MNTAQVTGNISKNISANSNKLYKSCKKRVFKRLVNDRKYWHRALPNIVSEKTWKPYIVTRGIHDSAVSGMYIATAGFAPKAVAAVKAGALKAKAIEQATMLKGSACAAKIHYIADSTYAIGKKAALDTAKTAKFAFNWLLKPAYKTAQTMFHLAERLAR